MALLVATFEVELQQNIYHNHLKDNCIQLWRNMSYTKFSNKIENTYSMNLLDVPFDKSECENCPFNSALAQLFGENNPKCQKAACFLNKKEEYFRNIVFKIIAANPNYPILYWNADIPKWLEIYSQSKDIDIIESYDFEYYPEMPEKPLAEEYTTDNQLDEENFSEALQEYENELSDYNKEIEEVKSDIKNGKFADCLIYDNGTIEVGYYLVEDIKEPEEQDTEETEGTGTQPNENEESNAVQSNPTPPTTPKRTFIIEKQKIESLKKQDERNFEISIENSVRDINEMFKNKTIEDTPKTVLEDNLLFSFLIYESDICKAHFFAEKQSVSLENCFETTKLITESDKTFIIREYLKKNLKSYAYGSKSFATSLFFQFAEQHFEIETKDIRKKLDEVYNKRKAKIEDEIKVLEDYIKDETNKA
jgi:ParB family chromosome partitioning protein